MSRHVKIVNAENFEQQVLRKRAPVLVDFYADWCGPCQAIAATVEQVAQQHPDTLEVVKVDVDREPELAQRYSVRSIPTLMLFIEGEAAGAVTGLTSVRTINNLIRPHLAA